MRILLTSTLLMACCEAAAYPQILSLFPSLIPKLRPTPKLGKQPASAPIQTPVLPPPVVQVPPVIGQSAQALPLEEFNTPKFARPLTLIEALLGVNASVTTIRDSFDQIKKLLPDLQLPDRPPPPTKRDVDDDFEHVEKRQNTCINPRNRTEWDQLSTSDKQAFVDGIKCLLGRKPSGLFRQAQNRYEDLVVLHQSLTPDVHGNAKFLFFHRYYLWAFEDVLRRECNYTRDLPWFDEAKYAGRFGQASLFSNQWFGAFALGGNCVPNGQIPYLAINIGPGPRNVRHCLSRNGDEGKTANTRRALTDACNSRSTIADMASCAEGAAHAWGHNGIGAVMQDTYAAPADPVFWLHHSYIDRNFRVWQDVNPSVRTTTFRGTDANNRPLSLDSTITLLGLKPDVRIRDLMNTQGSLLCYKYSY